MQNVINKLSGKRYRWLVTGGAGFIGSHLVENLLVLGQDVVTLDNLATGYVANLEHVRASVGEAAFASHRFIEGDIRDLAQCRAACEKIDFVLHQAALGSVPRSIEDPLTSNAANVTGFLNMMIAARDAGVRRFVYASSSSVYGDHPGLPKLEDEIGRPLSPYAVTKYVNELYADVFGQCYDMKTIGLRYFNVFGARQDPDGPYAAVIPRWIQAILRNDTVSIYGDGETSRDFCYVKNVAQVNLLSALADDSAAFGQAFNVAVNQRTSLNELFETLRDLLAPYALHVSSMKPKYEDFRKGDVRHSLADIGKVKRLLGYQPTHDLREGLKEALDWYVEQARAVDAKSAQVAEQGKPAHR